MKASAEQDLCQTAHTDPADPYEMNILRLVKINLIHGKLLASVWILKTLRSFGQKLCG